MNLHPVFQALGWAVLHFLWEGTLLALLLLLFNSTARRADARVRYAAACVVMLLMAACFVATMVEEFPSPESLTAEVQRSIYATTTGGSTAESLSGTTARLPIAPAPSIPADWIAYLWLLGVASMSFYTACGWARVQGLRRRTLPVLEIPGFDGLARRLGIRRVVRVCASAVTEVPSVIGWLKPCILLPVTALTGLTESQLQAILAHELAHIRRHDYLVNLLQTGVETLLFYHPAVWWVSRRIRQERENCCDDIAVALCGDPIEYAAALAEMEQIRLPELALAANGGELLARIRRVLGEPVPDARPLGAIAAGSLIVLIAAVTATALHAAPQQAKAAQFDVASVKQLDQALRPGQMDLSFVGTAGKPFKISGNRITVSGTLHALIADAYAVKDYQISALPPWADSLRFNIAAESPGTEEPTQDQVRPMLASLLADRFQLKFHRDSKELPVYHLVRVKPSKKFTPAGADEVFSWNLTQESGGLRSKATKESIGDFIQLVGVSADRPVIDKTGITGFIDYDIVIEQPGPAVRPAPGQEPTPAQQARAVEDQNRAIISAVVDQLGLKLESAKDSIDLLVIDHAEKPSAN